jgi:hypothetical protein
MIGIDGEITDSWYVCYHSWTNLWRLGKSGLIGLGLKEADIEMIDLSFVSSEDQLSIFGSVSHARGEVFEVRNGRISNLVILSEVEIDNLDDLISYVWS